MSTNFFLVTEAKHDADVRGVTSHPYATGAFLTASRDNTVRMWTTMSEGGQCLLAHSHVLHTHYVSTVICFKGTWKYFAAEVSAETKKALWFSASHDETVIGYEPESEQLEVLLDGHTGAVSCLAALGDAIVTGSWDGTAIMWNLDGSIRATLKGHTSSVLCVAYLPEAQNYGANMSCILTGSGDKTIIGWDMGGEKRRVYTHHTDSVQGLCEIPKIGFASCGNDAKIIVVTIKGDVLYTLHGHQSFVYDICVLPNTGEICSASEDRTLRIWKGTTCTHSFEHPKTVWCVCALDDHTVITGCADGYARVWSRDITPGEPIDMQNNLNVLPTTNCTTSMACENPIQLSQTVSPTHFDDHACITGTPSMDNSDNTTSYQMGQPQSESHSVTYASTKIPYDGKLYDYVFDVEVNGVILKLPYNIGENPYEVALEFIHRHSNMGLTQNDLNEVVQWITQHSQYTGNEHGKLTDEKAEESNKKGASTTLLEPSFFVLTTYVDTNFEGIRKKLLNMNVPGADKLVMQLSASNEASGNTLVELCQIIQSTPISSQYPLLDLLRHGMLLLHSEDSSLHSLILETVTTVLDNQENENPLRDLICLRILVNYLALMQKEFQSENLAPIIRDQLLSTKLRRKRCRSNSFAHRETFYQLLRNASFYIEDWQEASTPERAEGTEQLQDLIKSFLRVITDCLLRESNTELKVILLKTLLYIFVPKGDDHQSITLECAKRELTFDYIETLIRDPSELVGNLAKELLKFKQKR